MDARTHYLRRSVLWQMQGSANERQWHPVPVLLTLLAGVWMCGFLLSRAHMLHTEYNAITLQRKNEAWLFDQCTKDEFYDSMKHHSTVCDEVSTNTRKVPILQALEHMVENTYLCGYSPCYDTVDAVATWMLGRGLLFTLALCLMLVAAPAVLVPIYRRNMNVLADHRMKHLYNTPYGAPHYVTTHQHYGRIGL